MVRMVGGLELIAADVGEAGGQASEQGYVSNIKHYLTTSPTHLTARTNCVCGAWCGVDHVT